MARSTKTLLTDPVALRRALRRLLRNADAIELAVAFVGADWRLMLGDFEGDVRLVCWLDNTATDPVAVEQIMKVPHQVRQRTAMHAKVYLAYKDGQPVGAIVGSANLSRTALALTGASGQVEVGVLVEDEERLAQLSSWFEALWGSARKVTKADLKAAKLARKRRMRAERRTKRRGKKGEKHELKLAPVDPARLEAAIVAAREIDLIADIQGFGDRGAVDFMQQLDPETLDRKEASKVLEYLQPWVRDPRGISQLSKQPVKALRRSFSRVFDEGRDVTERLREALNDPGRARGLGLRSWSVLLYWRDPARCPPFNQRTEAFLTAIGLDEAWPKSPSASTYGRWLDVAERLRAQWDLETLGHVDRVVWKYASGEG